MADVALWLGPYMSISSKTSLYKDQKGPTMQANHNKPKNNTKDSRTNPQQIPQPDLPVRHEEKQTRHTKGARAQTQTNTEKICLRTQRFDHCVRHKNMPKMNSPPRPSVRHGNQSIAPAFVSIDAKNCTCSRAYKIASLSVLSDVLVQKATM